MCGRTSLAMLAERLRLFLQSRGVRDLPPWYTPRYNIAPTQDLMVIVERDGMREAAAMRWGLVPFWAKDVAIGQRMINARAETVAEKPAYRESFARRRGLVVVDSYYEWRQNDGGPKTPFRVHRTDDDAFTLAALWDRWRSDDGYIETCSVITIPAEAEMTRIHHRMPAIVSATDADAWLSTDTSSARLREIISAQAEGIGAHEISRYVNAPTNDGPECWAEVEAG